MADGSAHLSLLRDPDGGLVIVVGGSWRIAGRVPPRIELEEALASHPARVRFESRDLAAWDSSLVSFVAGVSRVTRERGIPIDRGGLPEGVRRLLELAETAPAVAAPPEERRPSFLARLGLGAGQKTQGGLGVLAFVGDTTLAIARMAVGRARFEWRELFVLIQFSGAQALGIVGLVSFLVGVILAFMGAVQLERFGAKIYIADLVGIAMVRELGAVMAAIVVAGRTGAAFAAELGTMRVSQEIDALATLGIAPAEFLVAPRVLALTLMLPFLCVYADILGVLGGAVVGVFLMDMVPHFYYVETVQALTTTQLFSGVIKAAAYGALVASAGCFEGLRSGRSASAVGRAATAAVVDGIVLVIAASGLFAVLSNVLGI